MKELVDNFKTLCTIVVILFLIFYLIGGYQACVKKRDSEIRSQERVDSIANEIKNIVKNQVEP